jgi:hypothetical protein
MSATTIPAVAPSPQIDPDSYLNERSVALRMKWGQKGISGWIFDIPTGEDVELSSDISDHYVESGSFISDHVVKKPIRITLTGLIGELVYTAPDPSSFEGIMSSLSSGLTNIPAYLGPLTPGMTQKMAVVASGASYAAGQVAAITKRASNLVKFFSGDDASLTKQQKAFYDIYALWKSNQIVTVQTPWKFFDNMMIESISSKQNETSNDYTDFSVTLKEMRFVDIRTTTFDSVSYREAIDAQKAQEANIGPVQTVPVNPDSIFTQLTGIGAPHQ